jgi:hypothetical protein
MANFAGEFNFIAASILLIFNLIWALLECAILYVLMLVRIATKKMGGHGIRMSSSGMSGTIKSRGRNWKSI